MKNQKNMISQLCSPISISGSRDLNDLNDYGFSSTFIDQANSRIDLESSSWGIPFSIEKVHVLIDREITFSLPEVQASWLCFLHTVDNPLEPGGYTAWSKNALSDWQSRARTGRGLLNQLAATYYIIYSDGSEVGYEIRNRHQIGVKSPGWGENCFQAVPEHAPYAYDNDMGMPWGYKQMGHANPDRDSPGRPFTQWICAWKNPHPDKVISGIRLEPGRGKVVLSSMAACETNESPIRWLPRQKLLLRVPKEYSRPMDKMPVPMWGNSKDQYRLLSKQRRELLNIDMGSLISVVPRSKYDNAKWDQLSVNSDFYTAGEQTKDEYIVEYVAHPEARLQLIDGTTVSLDGLRSMPATANVQWIEPAEKRVKLKVIDKRSRQPVAVRLHIHGEQDEYLAPIDRHRIPNGSWFEDTAPELTGPKLHTSTYINGETDLKLPLGKVYIQVSKGLECKPVHKVVEVLADSEEITIEVEKVLPWREKGWMTADTHVHFLSPITANLEGAAEGINVVNLLASQWGELMTNVGDFDGKSTFSHRESDADYLVRVGTENRQHVMGHISLLGYEGPMITPLASGPADEAAIGEPQEILITEWAQQCQKQGGLVVLPHFPDPRAENAATIVTGAVDAIEMHAFTGSIDFYSLTNWYRYLNCGYQVPLCGGTDKMSASMELGRIRTYSKLRTDVTFDYQSWKDSIRDGNTFVTIGPLIEFDVDGQEAGSRIRLEKSGGKLTVSWRAETIKYAMTGVELIVNGEVVNGKTVDSQSGEGYFELNITRSSWICLLVRGTLGDGGQERILAHTSSIMVEVQGSEFFSRADAVSILEQIEGSTAYLDHIGTRAETRRYKAMRLILEQAHKRLHDRLHSLGYDHAHDIGHNHH